MSVVEDNREVARTALEEVCARGDMELAPQCYAEDFADHVGSLERPGGQPLHPQGLNRGRRVPVWGIGISRLRDGRIVEDWASFDSFELLRRLGIWRTLLAAPRLVGALRKARTG